MDPMETSSYPGPITLLREAFSLYKLRFSAFLPIVTLAYIAAILEATTNSSEQAITFIASFLNFIIAYLSYIAIMYALADGTNPKATYLDYYYKAWNVFIPYIVILLLTGISVVASGVLLVVPGIIVWVYLSLASFVLVFEGLRGFSALAQSWRYVRGDWWKIFLRILVLVIFIIIVAAVASVIIGLIADPDSMPALVMLQAVISFFIVPISVSFMYHLYQMVKDKKAGPIFEQDIRFTRNRLLLLIILGSCVAIIIISLSSFLVKRGYIVPPTAPLSTHHISPSAFSPFAKS